MTSSATCHIVWGTACPYPPGRLDFQHLYVFLLHTPSWDNQRPINILELTLQPETSEHSRRNTVPPTKLSCKILDMTKPQAKRKRAYKPKVRTGRHTSDSLWLSVNTRFTIFFATGCDHCKARRRKCDESKPQCNVCVRYGVSCNYQFLPRRSRQDPSRHQALPLLLPAVVKRQQIVRSAVVKTTPYCHVLPKSTFGHQAHEDLEYMEFYVRKIQNQFSVLKSGCSDISDLCKHPPRVFYGLTQGQIPESH